MTYRPTVRYDPVFKSYVNELFHATTLDRNQIIRAALFVAGYSEEFQELMGRYQKKDLPNTPWTFEQNAYWLEQCPKIKVEEKVPTVEPVACASIKIKNEGGISYQL